MYKISPGWTAYYKEIQPERRFQLLETLLAEEADDGSNDFRKHLYFLRHPDGNAEKVSTDLYLWQCVNFGQIYDTSSVFKKSGRREIEKFLDDAGYSEAVKAGPDGERALYWEIRNAARRFFKTCTGSDYRRTLFGLLGPGQKDQKEHMTLDTWKMTEGVGKRLGLEEKLALWTQAVMDEYKDADPTASDRMNALKSKSR